MGMFLWRQLALGASKRIFWAFTVAVFGFSHHNGSSQPNGTSCDVQKSNEVFSYAYNSCHFHLLQPDKIDHDSYLIPVSFLNEKHFLYIHSKVHSNSSKLVFYQTLYVYQADLGSWYKPQNTLDFEIYHLSTVKLCHDTHIFFDLKNDLWLLDKEQLSWNELPVVSAGLTFPGHSVRLDGYTVVALKQANTNCSCKESVILFGGCSGVDVLFKRVCYNDLWELHCLEDGKRYEWRLLETDDSEVKPAPRTRHAAISSTNGNLMYVAGGNNPTETGSGSTTNVWQFSMLTRLWRRVSEKLPSLFHEMALQFFFLTGHNVVDRFFFFISANFPFLAFDMQNQVWITDMLPDLHSRTEFHSSSAMYNNNSLFIFTNPSGQSIRVTNVTFSSNSWQATDVEKSLFLEQTIFSKAGGAVVYTSDAASGKVFTLQQELLADNQSVCNTMGIFYMHLRKWTAIRAESKVPILLLEGHTITWIEHVFALVIFGGRFRQKNWSLNDRIYLFKNSVLLQLNKTDECLLLGSRYYHSSVSINKTSLVVFGGITETNHGTVLMDDLWIVTFFNLSSFSCVQIQSPVSNNTWPTARFGHSALQVNSRLIFYGGALEKDCLKVGNRSIFNCNDEIWAFSLKTFLWTLLHSGFQKDFGLCFSHISLLSPEVIVFGYGLKEIEFYNNVMAADHLSPFEEVFLRIYILTTENWIVYEDIVTPRTILTMLPANEQSLVAFLGDQLHIVELRCPRGMYSSDFPSKPCLLCPAGSYSAQVGQRECSLCPEGTTTPLNGSASLQNCMRCKNDSVCVHGVCEVVSPVGLSGRQWRCSCFADFHYDSEGICTRPLQMFPLIITVVSLVALCLISYLKLSEHFTITGNRKELYLGKLHKPVIVEYY